MAEGLEAGRKALAPIAAQIWPGLPPGSMARPLGANRSASAGAGRRSFSSRRSAITFIRDGFHCRYCGGETVPRPIAVLMSSLYPAELPYTMHYKAGMMHPLYWTRVAEADHLVPGSAGGAWTDPENHVTACVVCNTRKGRHSVEQIGWTLRSSAGIRTEWDGLTAIYRPIWERAGRISEDYHRPWLKMFDRSDLG